MGSMSFRIQQGKSLVLQEIFKGGYRYLVVLYGIDPETKEEKFGEYKTFKELNEEAIRNYAAEREGETGLKITRAEVHSLELKLVEKIAMS